MPAWRVAAVAGLLVLLAAPGPVAAQGRGGDTGWQINGDAAFHIGKHRSIYGGGGIAFAHPGGGETRTGYNLFAGVTADPRISRATPFLEARWTFVNDTSPFRLVLGFNYRLGG
jgi:hypothetical protein